MRKLKLAGILALAALAPMLMAPSGGFPSRPRFSSVGVNTTAPASSAAAARFLGAGTSAAAQFARSDNSPFFGFFDNTFATRYSYIQASATLTTLGTDANAPLNLSTGTGEIRFNGVATAPSAVTTRHAYALITDVGSSCATSSAAGITSSTVSSSGCVVNYTAAGFTATPVCTVTAQDGVPWVYARFSVPTSTSIFVIVRDSANGAQTSLDVMLSCSGT